MPVSIKPPVFADPADLTLGELLEAIATHSDRPLVFHHDGRPMKSGYHVTEVKAGQFSALDCGANPESWSEIFVQILDVGEGERTQMAAGKFAGIIGKVSEHLGLDSGAKLTFEVSDGVAPIELHRASAPTIENGLVRVALFPRPASCKPRDRWLDQKPVASCCSTRAEPCCG